MKTLRVLSASLIGFALFTTGCVTTQQARNVKASPFLGNSASLLTKGTEGESLLVYFNPNVNWKQYTKVIVDPVTFWVGIGESDGLSSPQRKTLCDYFYLQLVTEIGKSYTIVDKPEPGAIRVATALLNAHHGWPALETISTVYPAALVISSAKEALLGKASFVGEVTAAMKATDSMTGEVLAASTDERVGGMAWKGKFDRWSDVEDSSTYWSQAAVYRLCTLQGLDTCKKPTQK